MKITRIAFFDVDETLINAKTMFSFRAYYFQWLLGANLGGIAEAKAAACIERNIRLGNSRTEINTLFYKEFAGHRWSDLQHAVSHWYPEIRQCSDFFIDCTLQALKAHQRKGDIVAFVSGSAVPLLHPLATELQVPHVLANRLQVHQGFLTGELMPPQTIGHGKQQAALALMHQLGAAPENCHAYGDHLSDLPLLECVGHPVVVDKDPALLRHASAQGWPIFPSVGTGCAG